MDVNFHDEFWIINQEGFIHRDSDEYVSYPHPIPVYVQNIGQEWDGTKTFDIGPVDFSKPENKGASWRWRRTIYTNKDDNGWLYSTEKEARSAYEEKYSDEQKCIHATKREMHFIHDNRVNLDTTAIARAREAER